VTAEVICSALNPYRHIITSKMLHSTLKIMHQVKLARTPPSTFLFLPINLSNSSISKGS